MSAYMNPLNRIRIVVLIELNVYLYDTLWTYYNDQNLDPELFCTFNLSANQKNNNRKITNKKTFVSFPPVLSLWWSLLNMKSKTDLVVDQQLYWSYRCRGETLLLVSVQALCYVAGFEQSIFDEDRQSSQDERGKKIHVDVVPHAVEFPDEGEATIIQEVICWCINHLVLLS